MTTPKGRAELEAAITRNEPCGWDGCEAPVQCRVEATRRANELEVVPMTGFMCLEHGRLLEQIVQKHGGKRVGGDS